MDNYSIVIPARLSSTRLPMKLLQKVKGKPLIQWTWENANKARAKSVTVLTDAPEIAEIIEGLGGNAVLTSNTHETGTDRIYEYVINESLSDNDLIINLQGDEPLLEAALVDSLGQFMIKNNFSFATLCKPFDNINELDDRNKVKVVIDENYEALSFSRTKVSNRSPEDNFHHIGVYGYTVAALKSFANLKQSKNERAENLEQLRALDNGLKIHVLKVEGCDSFGIDTSEDLEKFKEILDEQ